MAWDYGYGPTKNDAKSIGGWVILGIIGLVLLVVLGSVFAWVWAPWKGKVEARNLTVGSGTYRIASYNAFFDQCGAIQSLEQQIQNTENAPLSDAMNQSQKAAILLALRNQHSEAIAQYNADAAKADTKAHFLSSHLPFHIDPNSETTTCAA